MNAPTNPLALLNDALLAHGATYDDGMAAASAALQAVGDEPADLSPLQPAIEEARHDLAGIAAIVAGSLIETGSDPGELSASVLNRLVDVYRDAVVFTQACRERFLTETGHDACEVCGHDEMEENLDYMAPAVQVLIAEEEPQLEQAWVAVDLVSRAAVALLSRDGDERRSAAEDTDLVSAADALSRFHGSAFFVWSLLSVLDDEEVLVLHPEESKGFRFRISGIGDNFQLHTLLIDALVDGDELEGRPLSGEAAAVARGTGPQASDDAVDGVWNLYTFEAVDAFGELPNPHALGGPFWIWNEGVPADIPEFEGTRIIMLGQAAYARSWNSARAFSALPVEFELLEKLSADAVDKWVERLAEYARNQPPES